MGVTKRTQEFLLSRAPPYPWPKDGQGCGAFPAAVELREDVVDEVAGGVAVNQGLRQPFGQVGGFFDVLRVPRERQ